MRTIIIADFVFIDNSVAIAAAAKGNMMLVIFGLALSVPIIGGSAIVPKMMQRFPIIITAGVAFGWLAADLIAHDPLLKDQLATLPAMRRKSPAGGALLVVVAGRIIAARNAGSRSIRLPTSSRIGLLTSNAR